MTDLGSVHIRMTTSLLYSSYHKTFSTHRTVADMSLSTAFLHVMVLLY